MRITDPGIIKNGEKDLIESLKEELDLDAVREIILKKMTAAALSAKGGEIVVHNNRIAFRMDFELALRGSLMFDRQGNHIPPESDSQDSLFEDLRGKGDTGLLDIDTDEKTKTVDNLDLSDYDLDTLDDIEELTEDPDPDTDLNETGSRIEEDSFITDDLVDYDITDILKESRDFWEKKKDS